MAMKHKNVNEKFNLSQNELLAFQSTSVKRNIIKVSEYPIQLFYNNSVNLMKKNQTMLGMHYLPLIFKYQETDKNEKIQVNYVNKDYDINL